MNPQAAHSIGNSYKWSVTILSGLFMFLALFVYRAYHIDEVAAFTGHSMLFRAASHSVIISVVFYLVEFHLSPRLRMKSRIKPLITALLAIFIGLNLTFLTFNYFFHWTEWHWLSYSQFLYEYPLILIIPLTLSVLIDRLASHNKAELANLVSISSENLKVHFQVRSSDLLFIKSADNYIEVFFRSGQQIEKQLVRKSLKDVEEELQPVDLLVRCHRSYLVNPGNIDQVRKTGSKIELRIYGMAIPVSKKYVERLSEKYPEIFTPHSKISPQTARIC